MGILPLKMIERLVIRLVENLAAESWDPVTMDLFLIVNQHHRNSATLQNAARIIKARRLEHEKPDPSREKTEEQTLQLAKLYISKGLFLDGIAELESALAQYPDSVVLHNALTLTREENRWRR
jgi:hypothetical protein